MGLMKHPFIQKKREKRTPPKKLLFYFFLVLTAFTLSGSPAFGIRLTMVKHLFDITQNFKAPSDVSVAKNGQIYVVDGVNSKIKVFSRDGKHVFAFGSRGAANGQFDSPLGIDIDRSGRVYIADSGNHRVQIFNPDGTFIAKIVIPPEANKLADPTDIAVDDGRNRCYVVDNDNHHILVYDLATLKQIGTYGSPGDGKRAFRYPFFIALGKEKELCIVDVINTRVQVLNPEGLFVTFIGGWGVEKGEFFRPKGVAVDKNGMVYVSDSYMGVIQVFDPIGEFHAALGGPEASMLKKFKTPVGLFIDETNRIYVVAMVANKVSVYQIEDTAGEN